MVSKLLNILFKIKDYFSLNINLNPHRVLDCFVYFSIHLGELYLTNYTLTNFTLHWTGKKPEVNYFLDHEKLSPHIMYVRVRTPQCIPLKNPSSHVSSLKWIVACKKSKFPDFHNNVIGYIILMQWCLKMHFFSLTQCLEFLKLSIFSHEMLHLA